MRENKKMRRLEPIAANILGRESFFGPNSLLILENRIFDLTGSKVEFSTTLHRVPSFNELEKGKQRGDKLIFLPDTMFVAVQRGEEVKNPRPTPITLENLFELFYSQTEARTIFRMRDDSQKEMAKKLIASKPVPEPLMDRKARSELVLRKIDELFQKFEGGILNLGGLMHLLSTNYDKKISGGYHFIHRQINEKLKNQEAFAGEKGSRLPSILELFLIELISSANNSIPEGWTWFPTDSLTEVLVEEPNLDPKRIMHSSTLSSKVTARYYVTSSRERGVGVSFLRDIPQYRQHVMTIK